MRHAVGVGAGADSRLPPRFRDFPDGTEPAGTAPDSPWIISKNYDAWGLGVPGVGAAAAAGAASRKRAVRPPPAALRQRSSGRSSKVGSSTALMGKEEEDKSSVVDSLKPLITLMQIGISMPVQRMADGTLVSKICLPVIVYSLVVFALLSVPVYYAASAAVSQLTSANNSFQEKIYNMTPLLLLHAHPLLPVLHWPEARAAAAYLNSWIKFEGIFQRTCGRPLRLQLRKWVARQTGVALLLAVFLAATMPLYMGLSWLQSLAYLHLYLLSLCQVSMWLYSSRALCRAAEALRVSLHEEVVGRTCTADLLADYRQAWLELSELTQQSGGAWTYSCGHLLLYLFLLMTVTSYGVLAGVTQHSLDARTLAYGAMAAGSAFTLFIVCSAAETAADTVAQVLREDLLMVQLSDDSQHFKNEVQMFMTALAMDPPIVNLSGYATVNRALFASLLETMVTYLVVLVQFAYSLDSEAAADNSTSTTTAAPKTDEKTMLTTVVSAALTTTTAAAAEATGTP